MQEFSIEIPDKDADAIHSGKLYLDKQRERDGMLTDDQWIRPLSTSSRSQMVNKPVQPHILVTDSRVAH